MMRLVTAEFQSDLSTLLPDLEVVSIRLNAVLSQPVKTSDCTLRPNLVTSFDNAIATQARLYLKKPMQYVVEPAFIITSGFNGYTVTLEKRLPIRTDEVALTHTNQIAIATFLYVIEVEVRRALYACLSVDKRC
jgi:hypothetical protein